MLITVCFVSQVLHCFKRSILWVGISWSLRAHFCSYTVSTSRLHELLIFSYLCQYTLKPTPLSLSLSHRSGYEQDVEFGNTSHLGDCHGELVDASPFRKNISSGSSHISNPVTLATEGN